MEGPQLLSCPALQIEAGACVADSGAEFGAAGGCMWSCMGVCMCVLRGCCLSREVDQLIRGALM